MDDKPTGPIPRADLDAKLAGVISGYRLTQTIVNWFLALVAVLAVISLVLSLTQAANSRAAIQDNVTKVVSAQCSFYRDVGTLPLAGPTKISQLGVKIVVDSRNSYIGLGCSEKLPAPSKTLVQDAAKYGLVLKG